jgi:FKBP-type peptidyl-prolyl cis-trans isomerase FklB
MSTGEAMQYHKGFEMMIRWKTLLALALIAGATAVQGGTKHKAQKYAMAQKTSASAEQNSAIAEKNRAMAKKNKKDGEAFLAENRAKEGVVTLESGLQYKILKAGEGDKPTLNDTVVVQYRSTFIDGTEFSNSYTRGQPGTFPVGKAIKGWQQALQLMPAGSKWQLVVPPHLAYGERGAGRVIGPNSTLIFEAELVAIKPPEKKAAPAEAGLKDIKISFKIDPRLTRSMYMGDRWVSPPIFTPARQGKTATVEASADGLDATGKRARITPQWIPTDPGMVEVTRGQGDQVQITVKRPGQSKVKVVAQGVTKELAIKAVDQGDAIAVEIVQ